MTSVQHTWRSALTHHPHVHMIVPGGSLSPNGTRWVACKPEFFLHVRVLSRLFRRLFIEGLMALHRIGELSFFGDLTGLSAPQAFETYLAPLRKAEWVVYAKLPFVALRQCWLNLLAVQRMSPERPFGEASLSNLKPPIRCAMVQQSSCGQSVLLLRLRQ